jgi:hypothetical protein
LNTVHRALRDFLAVRPADVASAVVGGIAVSVRAEPRFTRDLDFAVAVANDDEAANYVFRVRQHGYEIVSALEQTTQHRLSTIRLRRGGRGPIVDLLFAASGIEAEIALAAEPVEIAAGLVAEVAQVGHLIAMKLVSRDPKRRPRDQQDLVDLASIADDREWQRAEAAIELIQQRGFSRGRDLRAGLAEIRALAAEG